MGRMSEKEEQEMENLRRIGGKIKKIRRNGRNLSENGEKLNVGRWVLMEVAEREGESLERQRDKDEEEWRKFRVKGREKPLTMEK